MQRAMLELLLFSVELLLFIVHYYPSYYRALFVKLNIQKKKTTIDAMEGVIWTIPALA